MQEINDEPWEIRYLNSLYFSFVTMITIGYGDIHPWTSIEKVFMMFMGLTSCGVFAYAVNAIGKIFTDIA